jgi:hypothetical protein
MLKMYDCGKNRKRQRSSSKDGNATLPQDEFPLRTTREPHTICAAMLNAMSVDAPKPASPVHDVPFRETHVSLESFHLLPTGKPDGTWKHEGKTCELNQTIILCQSTTEQRKSQER